MGTVKRLLVYALPVALVALVWWFAGWGGDADAVERATSRRDAAVQSNAQAADQLRAATAFKDGGSAAQAELEALRTALPASPDVGRFVLLNGIAAERSGVVVSDLNPATQGAVAEPAPRGTSAIGIDIAVVGTQGGLDAYLRELEELPRIIVIDQLSTSRASDTTLQLSIHGRIFQLPDDKKPATGSKKPKNGAGDLSGLTK